jgi:aspartyl/asparaginyl-tRNA synthetase
MLRNVTRALGGNARAFSSCKPTAEKSITDVARPIPKIHLADFTAAVSVMRNFFMERGYLEVHTQNRLSILAACEDPTTISNYHYAGQVWPMPQTGQMWLEYEMLKNPDLPGLFCVSTSYRNEPNPVPGRHDLVFPMFEFELQGGFEPLLQMERDLCEYIGFGKASEFPQGEYRDVAKHYGVEELHHQEEKYLKRDHGPVYLLTRFPEFTSPFWNMKRIPNSDGPGGELSYKCDVIIHGVETIGSAERSCDTDDMMRRFLTISGGAYANLLYAQFTKERVLREMDEFLQHKFFPRSGGGIGVTRMISAMKQSGLLKYRDEELRAQEEAAKGN